MLPELSLKLSGYIVAIPMYNLMIGVGLAAAFLIWNQLREKHSRPSGHWDRLTVLVTTSVLVGFVSAGMFNNLVHSKPVSLQGGLSFCGGLIGGGLTYFVLYLVFLPRQHLTADANLMAPCLAIAHGFGRIGCFFAGCCYGQPVSWGVLFPLDSLPSLHYAGPVLPTQLIEAFFLFMLGLWLLRRPIGATVNYLMYYGLIRFCIEYFRGDVRGTGIWNFSPSQIVTLVLVILALALRRHPLWRETKVT